MPEVKMDRSEFLAKWWARDSIGRLDEFEADLDALLQSERDKTREECAKIAEAEQPGRFNCDDEWDNGYSHACLDCAQAIRKGGAR